MREIALHIIDIAENSISAAAKNIKISIRDDAKTNELRVSVCDDGCGMSEELTKKVTDPFTTSRTTRKVGLGIPLLKFAAESCNGSLKIDSQVEHGTCITATFQRDHIDRMPLGDIAGTILSLVVAHPEIHWCFEYSGCTKQGEEVRFDFDDAVIKETLDDIPLSDPLVLGYLRETLCEGIQNITAKLD